MLYATPPYLQRQEQIGEKIIEEYEYVSAGRPVIRPVVRPVLAISPVWGFGPVLIDFDNFKELVSPKLTRISML